MNFMHIGDLHLGKRVNGYRMLEEQKYILQEILRIAKTEAVNCILISGDVYDKTIPSEDAVELLDEFLTALSEQEKTVYLISGNHDSAERLDFASKLLQKNGVYIVSKFSGKLVKFSQTDEFGKVNFYLLPFLKPSMVRPFFPDCTIESNTDAVRTVLTTQKSEDGERNILMAHQFVTNRGAVEQCDSETLSLGGVEDINYSLFQDFDYVALGHLHSPQKVGRDEVRYAGSPLKYSFSEVRQKKSVTIVSLQEKGNMQIRQISLIPQKDMRVIQGPLEQLVKIGAEEQQGRLDFIKAILTDEEAVYDPLEKLRQVYPNIMTLEFGKSQREFTMEQKTLQTMKQLTPLELFEQFYKKQNQKEMLPAQKEWLETILEKAGEKENEAN